MLRSFVLMLLLANGVYYAWSQGLLNAWGFAPAEVSEPQRLAQQIRPEAIRLLRADEVRRIEATPVVAPRPTECLVAGTFDEAQTVALRRGLESSLASGGWEIEAANQPGRWIVYMGRYPNEQALAAKRAELSNLKLTFGRLNDPALEPGLSLGAFTAKEEAESALAALSKRGVRTAKVLQERGEPASWQVKLAAVDDALRARLEELKPVFAGKPLRPCK
jgi:hypothetical protein